MKRFAEKDIPQEVWDYMIMTSANGGLMGLEMYKKCQAIIEKYPDWFPWEHKYKSIPQEVHDAYLKEKNPDMFLSYDELQQKYKYSGKGFIGYMNESHARSLEISERMSSELLNEFSIADAFKGLIERDEKEVKDKKEKVKKDKALWDKHYKKYGLNFRV